MIVPLDFNDFVIGIVAPCLWHEDLPDELSFAGGSMHFGPDAFVVAVLRIVEACGAVVIHDDESLSSIVEEGIAVASHP